MSEHIRPFSGPRPLHGLLEDLTGDTATPVVDGGGYAFEHTLKRRAAVYRDVTRLLDDLAPERPPARHDAPRVAVRCHRSPGRCILQGATRAVTVSWFPTLAGDASLGELVVIAWRGTVSLPGSAQRAPEAAEPTATLALEPALRSDGEWEWRTAGDVRYTTTTLAAHCRELLEEPTLVIAPPASSTGQ